jgi:hypothetical protein
MQTSHRRTVVYGNLPVVFGADHSFPSRFEGGIGSLESRIPTPENAYPVRNRKHDAPRAGFYRLETNRDSGGETDQPLPIEAMEVPAAGKTCRDREEDPG